MYMVILIGSNTPPTKIWDNYDDASNEAERLCKKENKTTYIAKLVSRMDLEIKTINL